MKTELLTVKSKRVLLKRFISSYMSTVITVIQRELWNMAWKTQRSNAIHFVTVSFPFFCAVIFGMFIFYLHSNTEEEKLDSHYYEFINCGWGYRYLHQNIYLVRNYILHFIMNTRHNLSISFFFFGMNTQCNHNDTLFILSYQQYG